MEELQKTTRIARKSSAVEIDIGKGLFVIKREKKKEKITGNELIKGCSGYQIMVRFESQPKEYIVDKVKC